MWLPFRTRRVPRDLHALTPHCTAEKAEAQLSGEDLTKSTTDLRLEF